MPSSQVRLLWLQMQQQLCNACDACSTIDTLLFRLMLQIFFTNSRSLTLYLLSTFFPHPLSPSLPSLFSFSGRGVDMLERGSVVVLAHPGPDTPEDWKAEYPDVQSAMSVPVQPPTPTSTSSTSTSSSTSSSNVPMKDISVHMPPSGTTRMRLAFCGGVLRAVTPNLTLVSAIFNVDPRLAVVPSTLINFMTRSMAHYGFEMLRSQMLKFKDSPFAKRMEAKPWFYDDIRARIDDMWAARAVLSPTSASASPPPATAAVAAVAAANTASSGGTLADSAPSANGERTEEKKSSDESTAASSSSSSSSPLIPLTVPALAPALQMPLSPEDLIFGTAVLGHKIFGRAPPTSSSSSSSASSSGSDAQAKTSGGSMFVKGGGGESGTAYYALRMRDPHLLFVGSCDVLTEGRFMGSSWRDVYLFVRDDGVYIANEDAAEKFLDEVASSPVSLPSSVAAKDSSPASTAAAATTPAVTVCPNVEKFYASLRASDPKKRTVSHFIPATTIFSLGASNSSSSSSTSPDASLSSLELVPSLTYTVGAYVSTDDSQVMNVYLGRGVEAFDATVQDTTGYPSYKEASGSAPLLTAESIKARVSSSSSPGSSPVSAFVGGRRVQIRLRSDGHTHLAVWAFNEFASRWTTATSSMAAANASSPTAATASSTPK